MANHLTMEERERISQMCFAGSSKSEIARTLGRHRSTIGREVKRNCVDGKYTAICAQQAATSRRQNRPRKLEQPELNELPEFSSSMIIRWFAKVWRAGGRLTRSMAV